MAAAQRLKALEERARRARDSREKRFRLGDRVGNLRRARRAVLADLVEPDVREARTRLESWVDDRAIEIDGGLRDALAIATTAPLRAPVVVDPEVVAGLGGPDAAFEWLSAPLAIG